MPNSKSHFVNRLPENWRLFDSAEEVAQYTSHKIMELADEAISERGAFHLVTAGGTTPLSIYRILAELDKSQSTTMNWEKWHIYLGDERCLPKNDPERNSVSLNECWLGKSRIPRSQIHMIPAELGAKEAAANYEKIVKGIFFDCVLLGMGEDGHTASLFPDHNHEHEQKHLVQTEFHSPKPPAERVTLSSKCLSQSRHLFKLVTGGSKQNAVGKWLAGTALPIAEIQATHTQVFISEDSLPKKVSSPTTE